MIAGKGRWLVRFVLCFILGFVLVYLLARTNVKTTAAATPFPPTGVWAQYTNSNSVKDLAWHEGALWAATYGGLVRWQPGLGTYTKYTTGDVGELPSVNLFRVAVDPKNGDVWTGTDTGEVAVRHADNSWDTYTHDEVGILTLTDITIAPDGKVWLAGQTKDYRSGFSFFDGTTWQPPINLPDDAGTQANSMAFGAGDDVWVGTEIGTNEGLYLYNSASNTWTSTATCDIANPPVRALAYNPLNGDLWLGIYVENGPNLLRIRQGLPCETFDNFDDVLINAIAIEPSGETVWIATENYGAYRWRSPDQPAAGWTHYVPELGGLIHDDVNAIEFGANGDVWLGTLDGTSRLDSDERWAPPYQTHDGLGGSKNSAIAIDFKGRVWTAAALNVSLNIYDPTSDRWQAQRFWECPELAGEPTQLDTDSAGRIWVGTEQHGVRLLDPGSDPLRPCSAYTWQRFDSGNTPALLSNEITAIQVNSTTKEVWVGTHNGGLSVYQIGAGIWSSHTFSNTRGSLASDEIRSIAFDSDGNSWVGTKEGLSVHTPAGEWTKIDGFTQVQRVAVDGQKNVWVGAEASLTVLSFHDTPHDQSDDERTDFTSVGSQAFSALFADTQEGLIWFGDGNGVKILDTAKTPHVKGDDRLVSFGPKDGLPDRRVNDIALSQSGEVWLASEGGLARLRPVVADCANAVTLSANASYASELIDAADIDKYRIEVPADAETLALSLADPQDQLLLDLSISCATGDIGQAHPIGQAHVIGGEKILEFDVRGRPGTYYVFIQAKAAVSEFPFPYRLHVVVRSENDPDPAVRTLILTDKQRLHELYPDSAAAVNTLFDRLRELAELTQVRGLVIDDLEDPTITDQAVADAYTAWINEPSVEDSPARANALAAALRTWISNQRTDNYPALRYVVIVGDDRVVPFARVTIPRDDGLLLEGWVDEDDYDLAEDAPYIALNTPVGYALDHNFVLSDNIYGTQQALTIEGRAFDLPDVAVGRLVEDPTQMRAQIDTFINLNGRLTVDNALLAGYDFMEDTITETATILHANANVAVTQLLSRPDPWSASTLKNALNQSTADLVMLSAHANDFSHGTAVVEPWLRADELVQTEADAQASLVYAVACHAGLNAPGDMHPEAVDFPEVWAGWGATAIGATGWAYGGRFERAYLEELLVRVTANLATARTVGDALVQAKRAYYEEHIFNAFHEQTLATTTLYGLPMLAVTFAAPVLAQAKQTAVSAEFVISSQLLPMEADGLLSITYTLPISADGFTPITTSVGTYYIYDNQGRPINERDRPIMPYFSEALGVTLEKSLPAHGVFWLGGHYRELANFNPVIEAAIVLTPTSALSEPKYEQNSWWPALPTLFSRLETTGTTSGLLSGTTVDAQVVGFLSQYRGTADQGVLRLYQTFDYQVFYSDKDDFTSPVIQALSATARPEGLAVTATIATPVSDLYRVIATYTTGNGQWATMVLTHELSLNVWRGLLPSTTTDFVVQAADDAGNVASAQSSLVRAYLPVLAK